MARRPWTRFVIVAAFVVVLIAWVVGTEVSHPLKSTPSVVLFVVGALVSTGLAATCFSETTRRFALPVTAVVVIFGLIFGLGLRMFMAPQSVSGENPHLQALAAGCSLGAALFLVLGAYRAHRNARDGGTKETGALSP